MEPVYGLLPAESIVYVWRMDAALILVLPFARNLIYEKAVFAVATIHSTGDKYIAMISTIP